MKKRIISVAGMLVLTCAMLFGQGMTAAAGEGDPVVIDGSQLTLEEAAEGITMHDPLLRGVHLMDGNSGIVKAGTGIVHVYGATTANHKVDFVSVVLFVEQYNQASGRWYQVATWTAEDTNAYYVSTAGDVAVPRGYYYRVHCEHYAGNKNEQKYDHDFSFTDGIKIP